MAVKGSVNTKIDTGALEAIIIYGKQYGNNMAEWSTAIHQECRKMANEESLTGGDGEEFRAAFAEIAKAASEIEKSSQVICRVLDDHLGKAIQMKRGKTSGAAKESATKSAQKAGVLKN